MGREFWNAVEENPIIAAVKSMDDLEQCCKLEDIRVVFIFEGEYAHSCEGRYSPSDSPFLATLKNIIFILLNKIFYN